MVEGVMNCPNSDFRDSEVLVGFCEMQVDEATSATEVNVVMSIPSLKEGANFLFDNPLQKQTMFKWGCISHLVTIASSSQIPEPKSVYPKTPFP